MNDKMFCSKCGAADQSPDSYCRKCGTWLIDPNENRRHGPFGRKRSRGQRIRSIRILQIISIGLSITSTLIIVHVISNGVDQEMLPLAAFCAFLVAVYQTISLLIGNKVLIPKNDRQNETIVETKPLDAAQPNVLRAADTGEFVTPGSVTDNTTELLEPVPRYKAPNDRQN